MFFSTDLLSKKSPMGVVWLVSHGKRVSKQKIMQIKVDDMCSMLLEPEVPQALRLQGILCAGVAIVFQRQQDYLLRDCQDTMKRLMHLLMPARNETTMLPRGKEAATTQAITLDLNRVPIDEALSLQPLPGGSAIGKGDNGEDLFYMEWDVDALGLVQGPDASASGPPLSKNSGPITNLQALNQAPEGGISSPSGRHLCLQHTGNALVMETPVPHIIEQETFVMPANLEVDEENGEFNLSLHPQLDHQQGLPGPEGDEALAEYACTVPDNQALPCLSECKDEAAHQGTADDALQLTEYNGNEQEHQQLPLPQPAGAIEWDVGMTVGDARQKCSRGNGGRGRKRRAVPIQDASVLINTHTYRDWQQSSTDLVSEVRSLKRRRQLACKWVRANTNANNGMQELQRRPALKSIIWGHPKLTGLMMFSQTPQTSILPAWSEGGVDSNIPDLHLRQLPATMHNQHVQEVCTVGPDASPQQPRIEVDGCPSMAMQLGSEALGDEQELLKEDRHQAMVAEEEGQDCLGRPMLGMLAPAAHCSEAKSGLRRLSVAVPGSSSDIEIEQLRAAGSTPGFPGSVGFLSYGVRGPSSLSPNSAADRLRSNPISLPEGMDSGSGHRGGLFRPPASLSGHAGGGHLDLQSPIKLRRFQGLVDTPDNPFSKGFQGLPPFPGDNIGSNDLAWLEAAVGSGGSSLLADDSKPHPVGDETNETTISEGYFQATRSYAMNNEAVTEETWQCIHDLRDAFEGSNSRPLSLFDLMSGLGRFQAAQFFFQIQVMLSAGFIEANQEVPFGDLILSCGPDIHKLINDTTAQPQHDVHV